MPACQTCKIHHPTPHPSFRSSPLTPAANQGFCLTNKLPGQMPHMWRRWGVKPQVSHLLVSLLPSSCSLHHCHSCQTLWRGPGEALAPLPHLCWDNHNCDMGPPLASASAPPRHCLLLGKLEMKQATGEKGKGEYKQREMKDKSVLSLSFSGPWTDYSMAITATHGSQQRIPQLNTLTRG